MKEGRLYMELEGRMKGSLLPFGEGKMKVWEDKKGIWNEGMKEKEKRNGKGPESKENNGKGNGNTGGRRTDLGRERNRVGNKERGMDGKEWKGNGNERGKKGKGMGMNGKGGNGNQSFQKAMLRRGEGIGIFYSNIFLPGIQA